LETLHLEDYVGDDDIDLVLVTAERCRELRFLAMVTPPFESTNPGYFEGVAGKLPYLETLNLSANVEPLTRFLRQSPSQDQVLKNLTITIFNGYIDDESEAFLAESLLGVEPLHSINIASLQRILVKDYVGRTRELMCWNEDNNWEWERSWLYLCESYNAHMTIKSFTMSSTGYWDMVAESFAGRAPQVEGLESVVDMFNDHAEEIVNDVDSGGRMISENGIAANGLRYMRVLGLGKIKFTIHARRITNGAERAEIIRKLIGTIICRSNRVQICLSEAGVACNTVQLEEMFREDKRWSICNNCVSKIPENRGVTLTHEPRGFTT
jgi:hypothetical protein